MPTTIDEFKEIEAPPTPLFIFDCVLASGATEYWSTHAVTVAGQAYGARVLKYNLFELRTSADEGLDGAPKVTITLANADSHFSEIERSTGFKGAKVTIQFLFYDLVAGAPASETRVVYLGIGNPAEEITESTFRLSFTNRLNLQLIKLPEVRIERLCPWMFPSTLAQRQEALDGGVKGKYSALYRCGYSPDQTGGVGNLNSGTPFTSCDFTRASCIQRGMFDTDSSSNVTSRFGGLEFVPAQILVRSYREKGTQLSAVVDNLAVYSDVVPLAYGTAWFFPPIVFSRNDGNLTRMEVLLGMGEIASVITVLVNDIQIPEGQASVDMTGTGWFNLVTPGTRNGAFDLNFTDSSGSPLGDPYGNMAMMSVVVPNLISNGQALPTVQVLLNGLQLEQFDSSGTSLGESFSNNPAWVLLDVLRRSGWLTTEIDLVSFATAAAYCAETVETTDLNGNSVTVPQFQCNLVLQDSISASEAVRGIRNGSTLMLTYNENGLLTVRVENTLALQQPTLPDGSNSTETLNGGWPAYEFSDGSATFSGLVRSSSGEPAIRLWSRISADTANNLTVEFQDEFNAYQQDSLSLVDVDDALLTQREVTKAFSGLGLPNFYQATRVLALQLNKTIDGYTLIDFETTVKGIGIGPGNLITITYLKEGLERQPFRVTKIAPGKNYQTVQITAQWHDDSWYTVNGSGSTGAGLQAGAAVGLPRPLVGSFIDVNGIDQFGITESTIENSDGSFAVQLALQFTAPSAPAATSVGIPLLSLNPTLISTGGTLVAAQTLYYAVSAVDASGAQGALSFVVAAKIPAGTNTNQVSLTGLSFSTSAAGFNVYRGPNPTELLEIASNVAVAATFTDSGLTPVLVGPPDANYDHANFYWRLELQPEVVANIQSSTTVGNSTLGMLSNDFAGELVRITRGTGATQERSIVSNTATTLTVTPAWTVTPDSTSYFVVASSTWNFGGFGATSPVQIEVPNQTGATVEVSGRSANALNQESAAALNPLTRWQIGGAGDGGVDTDVPPQPVFGLNLVGQGTVDLVGISFTSLTDTHTILAGTLTLFFWNELSSPSTFTLGSAAGATDATVTLSAAGPATAGNLIQIEGEILEVTGTASGGLQYNVVRGSHGSTAASHAAGIPIYHLQTNVSIMPFVPDFFGSPASGSYSASIFLPDVRIGAAEFFVTNVRGNGPVSNAAFGATVDQGLRTLSGGQLSIQVDGYLAIETDAAPPLVIEDTLAARDITAVVSEAPSGGPIELQLFQNTTAYCTLTIADGTLISGAVNGFGLPPLLANAQLTLNITLVPGATGTLPGRNLTVTIRL